MQFPKRPNPIWLQVAFSRSEQPHRIHGLTVACGAACVASAPNVVTEI